MSDTKKAEWIQLAIPFPKDSNDCNETEKEVDASLEFEKEKEKMIS